MVRYSNPRVLVIEDDPEDFSELQENLQKDFTLSLIRDFDQYKVMPQLKEIDVALVDLYENGTMEPKGLEIIKVIRAADPKRHIPIIVISTPGKAELEHVTQAMEDGCAQDFIWKHGPRAATKDEIVLKVLNAWRQAQNGISERNRRRFLLRVFMSAVTILAISTVVSAVLGQQAAAISCQSLLILVSAISFMPWSERYI
jgi:PleD family two-component response regulator